MIEKNTYKVFNKNDFFENLLKNILKKYSQQSFFTEKDLTIVMERAIASEKIQASFDWSNLIDHHYMNLKYKPEKKDIFLIEALLLNANIGFSGGGLKIHLSFSDEIKDLYKVGGLGQHEEVFINWFSPSKQRITMYSILIDEFINKYNEIEKNRVFGESDYPLNQEEKNILDTFYMHLLEKMELKFIEKMDINLKEKIIKRIIKISDYKIALNTFDEKDFDYIQKQVRIFKFKESSDDDIIMLDDSFKIYMDFLNRLEEKNVKYLKMVSIEKREIFDDYMLNVSLPLKEQEKNNISEFFDSNALKENVIEKENSLLISKVKLNVFDVFYVFSPENLRENIYPIFKESKVFNNFSFSTKRMGAEVENYYNINWNFKNNISDDLKEKFSKEMKVFLKELLFNIFPTSMYDFEHKKNVANQFREMHLQMLMELNGQNNNSKDEQQSVKRKI